MTHLAAFLFLVAIQGFLLQTAVALTGEAAPRYGAATVTALWAGLVSTLAYAGFRLTAGIVLWMFMGSTAVWLAGLVVMWLGTAVVYRRRMELSGGHALLVALLHHVMAATVSGAIWFATSLVA